MGFISNASHIFCNVSNENCFTNGNGARTNLEMYLKDSDIMQILKNGMNIDSYCSLEDICVTFINEMRQLNMSRGSY